MTSLQRIDAQISERVLGRMVCPPTKDRQREAALSERMGAEERQRVAAATREAEQMARQRQVAAETEIRRAIAAGIAAERGRLEAEYAKCAASSAKIAAYTAREAERERCLAICRLWPDNLMAKEIAKRIEGGE
jgi:hypothetical protein